MAGRISKVWRSQDLALKIFTSEFNRAIFSDNIATQRLFDIKQGVNGNTKLQYFTAQHKRAKNGRLNPSRVNPDPLPFANVAKSWGVNSYFTRRMFLNFTAKLIRRH